MLRIPGGPDTSGNPMEPEKTPYLPILNHEKPEITGNSDWFLKEMLSFSAI